MSLYDYEVSKRLFDQDIPFHALIMAAMRRADTLNAWKLSTYWPETSLELQERYNAPGGLLEGGSPQ